MQRLRQTVQELNPAKNITHRKPQAEQSGLISELEQRIKEEKEKSSQAEK